MVNIDPAKRSPAGSGCCSDLTRRRRKRKTSSKNEKARQDIIKEVQEVDAKNSGNEIDNNLPRLLRM
jgi:hypothetical protein